MTPPNPAGRRAKLRLLATTDLHGALLDYDYYADRPATGAGLSRIATLIEGARAEQRNCLLFDNGDMLQGTPLVDLVAGEGLNDGDTHPIIAAMNTLGYDAATPGNHEFDYGMDYLDGVMQGASFPFVCANMDGEEAPGNLIGWTVLARDLVGEDGTRHRIGVGVTGVLPQQVERWNAEHLAGRVRTRDMVAAVAETVPQMKEAGADVVVVLGHTGLGAGGDNREGENVLEALAEVPGVDALVGGHSHRLYPEEGQAGALGRVATVQAGSSGSHLGVIDLDLEESPEGWRVCAGAGSLRAAEAAPKGDARIEAGAAQAHARTLTHIRRVIGRTAAPIRSHFALVGDDSCMRVINSAQTAWVRRMLVGTEWAELPVIGAAAPFKAGGWPGPSNYVNLPAGPLSVRSVADLYGYPNNAVALLVNGTVLRDWLDRSVSIFRTLVPGAGEQPLFDPGVAGFTFDILSDLTWVCDLSVPPRPLSGVDAALRRETRVRDLAHKGQAVTDRDRFILVTNTYRAGGGGDFPAVPAQDRLPLPAVPVRDILRDHIEAQGTIDPRGPASWRFAPMEGATAIFDTGPGGDPSVVEGVEPAGDGADGFCRFRLPL